MATRKVKDAYDTNSNELVYFKGHAQATYMSDGTTVEDAINSKASGGSEIKVWNKSADLLNVEDGTLKLLIGTGCFEQYLSNGETLYRVRLGTGLCWNNNDINVNINSNSDWILKSTLSGGLNLNLDPSYFVEGINGYYPISSGNSGSSGGIQIIENNQSYSITSLKIGSGLSFNGTDIQVEPSEIFSSYEFDIFESKKVSLKLGTCLSLGNSGLSVNMSGDLYTDDRNRLCVSTDIKQATGSGGGNVTISDHRGNQYSIGNTIKIGTGLTYSSNGLEFNPSDSFQDGFTTNSSSKTVSLNLDSNYLTIKDNKLTLSDSVIQKLNSI